MKWGDENGVDQEAKFIGENAVCRRLIEISQAFELVLLQ